MQQVGHCAFFFSLIYFFQFINNFMQMTNNKLTKGGIILILDTIFLIISYHSYQIIKFVNRARKY